MSVCNNACTAQPSDVTGYVFGLRLSPASQLRQLGLGHWRAHMAFPQRSRISLAVSAT